MSQGNAQSRLEVDHRLTRTAMETKSRKCISTICFGGTHLCNAMWLQLVWNSWCKQNSEAKISNYLWIFFFSALSYN